LSRGGFNGSGSRRSGLGERGRLGGRECVRLCNRWHATVAFSNFAVRHSCGNVVELKFMWVKGLKYDELEGVLKVCGKCGMVVESREKVVM